MRRGVGRCRGQPDLDLRAGAIIVVVISDRVMSWEPISTGEHILGFGHVLLTPNP